MKARVIAFYLPQFHPIPENNKWWGAGFTEWTNLSKARPLWPGHKQPNIPGELGFYDLRLPETREAQAELAREHGIEGFCYWHYWFGNGRRLLERPFNEVLESGKPDFPFCLAWANESWQGLGHGLINRETLIEQQYPGISDYEAHFYAVLPALRDPRYITVDKKPLFIIYKPLAHPDIPLFIRTWRRLATENGLAGIHFVGQTKSSDSSVFDEIRALGFDAVNPVRLTGFKKHRPLWARMCNSFNAKFRHWPKHYAYGWAMQWFLNPETDSRHDIYPSLISGWDHTPRSGRHGLALYGFTPELFRQHVHQAVEFINAAEEGDPEHRILFLKSWNEWAEGNYVEPDLRHGRAMLEAIAAEVKQ